MKVERCGLNLLLLNRQGFTQTSCLALLPRGSCAVQVCMHFVLANIIMYGCKSALRMQRVNIYRVALKQRETCLVHATITISTTHNDYIWLQL